MADIPLPTPTNEDIYSLGFGKSLQRGITDNSTGVVYDTIENSLNTGSVLSGGNLNLKTLSIGGLVRQVAPGDDIQAAIDAVNRDGGGTVQLIGRRFELHTPLYLKSNVHLAGQGNGETVLDWVGHQENFMSLNAIGSATEYVSNFSIRGITVKDSSPALANSIYVSYGEIFRIEDCIVDGGIGIGIYNANDFIISNTSSINGEGFFIYANAGASTERFVLNNCYANGATTGFTIGLSNSPSDGSSVSQFTLLNCTADSNTGHGFYFVRTNTTSSQITYKFYDFSVLGCRSLNNVGRGFLFYSDIDTTRMAGRVADCFAFNNVSNGYDVGTNVVQVSFSNCTADSNLADGFNIDGQDCTISGCFAYSNGIYDTDINNDCTITGGTLGITSFDTTKSIICSGNFLAGIEETIDYADMINVSGTQLRPGNVVVISPTVSSPNKAATTTTNGDNKVIGMANATITNSQFGNILTRGFTTLLYAANGTSSITIGDWLSTYSHAYYAKKAVAGDMAFAIALETPTTSTAQIDALLVSPRLI